MKYLKSTLKKFHQFTLIFIICCVSTYSFGQDYYHGIGVQMDIATFKLESNDSDPSTTNASVPGLFYKATLALSDNFAISAYPFIGLSGNFNSQTGGNGSIGFQLPINAELYFGDIDESCFFIGAGFALAALGSTDSGGGAVIGPQVALGGQFEIKDQLIGLRAAFALGLNKEDTFDGFEYTKDSRNLISLGVYYMFGS